MKLQKLLCKMGVLLIAFSFTFQNPGIVFAADESTNIDSDDTNIEDDSDNSDEDCFDDWDDSEDEDEDDDGSASKTIVPFQIAYAVSIHKAQGLEYSSVKLVITDEVDELITHNIFYTAITRTQDKLKIYWTPEVEEKILKRIKPRDIDSDIEILSQYLQEP